MVEQGLATDFGPSADPCRCARLQSEENIAALKNETTVVQYDIAVSEATAATTERIIAAPCPGGIERIFDGGRPHYFEARADFATIADAQDFAAQFPKLVRMTATECVCYNAGAESTRKGIIVVRIHLGADGVNGGVNETGLRRIKTLARICERLGIRLERKRNWANSAERTIQEYGWLA